MKPNVISIVFETNAQNADGRFSVPKEICQLLGVGNGDNIVAEIKGERIFTSLRSGTEVYGADIRRLVKVGERIRVTISRA